MNKEGTYEGEVLVIWPRNKKVSEEFIRERMKDAFDALEADLSKNDIAIQLQVNTKSIVGYDPYVDKINTLDVEMHEEEPHGFIQVTDGSGQNVTLRVDLRWVSIQQAVDAAENTFIQDQVKGAVSDILVTKRLSDQHTMFEILDDSGQHSIEAYGRCRP
jgi:hypothetical protein